MNLLPTRRERLYYVIRQCDNSLKFYDSYLNIIISEKEFKVLSRNHYHSNLNVIFDNHLEQ